MTSAGPSAALITSRSDRPSGVGDSDLGGAGRLSAVPAGPDVDSPGSELPPQPPITAPIASRLSSAGARRGARIGAMLWTDRVPGVLDEKEMRWLSERHW